MVTINQIRAARALLGWNQDELAEHAGLSLATVANIEQGRGKMRGHTLDAVRTSFERAGVEFTPEPGVRLRREKFNFRILEGDDAIFELWNDIVLTLGATGGEVLMSGISEQTWLAKYKKEMTANILRQRALKIYPRVLLAEGDNLVIIGSATYRAVPKFLFQQSPYFVYGDRFAIINWGPPQRVLLVQNAAIAETFRHQFEFNWQIGRELDDRKVVVAKMEGLPHLPGKAIIKDK
jgi:transcriptional regulator with XRE-family HTH domain